MATMDSTAAWAVAAGDPELGLEWRDAVTARMVASPAYTSYEGLVGEERRRLGLPLEARARLLDAWRRMQPWPDARALGEIELPFAFLTNCSARLASLAVARSGLHPRFVLSAEEVGWYKPDRRAYLAACQRLRVSPEETLFVAGAAYDAAGARAAGLRACLVRRRRDVAAPAGMPAFNSLGAALHGG